MTSPILPSSPTPYGIPRGRSTWALRPLVGNYVGDTIKISDHANRQYLWDGSAWAASSGVVVAQSGIPVILGDKSVAGISATTGAFTLATALPVAYTNGAWMFLPADAVVDGLAGFYWCMFSSTTAGVVKKNASGTNTCYVDPATTAFTPFVPSGTLTFAVGAAATWTATATADIALVNTTIPAGLMGASGKVRTSYLLSTSNSGNAKAIKANFGALAILSTTTTTTLGFWVRREVFNVTAAAQITSPVATLDEGTTAVAVRGTVDTTADVAMNLTGQLHTTDAGAGFIILEAYTVEVLPGA